MANSAFDHSAAITLPSSSTNTALVRWSGTGGNTLTDSTILVGATTMGLAADTDLLTFSNGTLTIGGTLAATTLTGAGSGITGLNASNLGSGTIPDARFPATLPAISGANLTNLPASGATLSGSTNNTVVTVTGSNAMVGETNLTYDGSELTVGGTSAKLVIDQSSGDGYVFELRSSDVGHGLNGYTTSTYGQFMKKHADSGMLQIWGFSDANANQAIGLSMVGVSGIAANATKTTSAIGIVEILGGIKDGGNIANPATDGNILVVRDAASGSAKMIVDQDGSLTLPTAGSEFKTGGGAIGQFHFKMGNSGATPNSSYNHVNFEGASRVAVNILCPSNSESHFGFAWPSYSQGAGVYTNSNSGSGYYAIQVHGAEKLRITSGGVVSGQHGTYHTSSDSRIKENVADITFGLAHVLQMRPVSFNFTDWYDRDGIQETRLGFIAQEVKTVVPNAVKVATHTVEFNYDDENDVRTVLHEPITDMHSIEDTQMIPVLVKAIQELKAEIDALKG